MSQVHFEEAASADPVERAIARKVVRILNDVSLTRDQRVALVREAQAQLLRHRQHSAEQAVLARCVAALRLPPGSHPVAVQVVQGRIAVQVKTPGGLTWLDAGAAPAGVPRTGPCRPLRSGAHRKPGGTGDAIAERRRALAAGRA